MRVSVLRSLVCAVALALGMAAAGGAASPASAVIGGSPASIADNPWEVMLVIDGGTLCSGSLVSPSVVVTAAHCFTSMRDVSRIEAFAGITAMSERSADTRLRLASVTVHPDFDPSTFVNDIAVLTLATPITPSSTVGVIALPYGLDAATWPAAGTPARIAGWGITSPTGGKAADSLQSATVQLLANPGAPCGQYGTAQPANILCAGVPSGGIDTCQGDSGSGLVVDVNGRPVLAGVTSTGAECAQVDFPGVYTSIAAKLGWLAQFTPQTGSTVAASSPAAGVLAATWSFADVATPVSAFTATFTASGAPALTCTTAASTCSVSGARRGLGYMVSVSAAVPAGTVAVGQTGPVVSASATSRVGASLTRTRLAAIAGMKVLPTKVSSSTKSVCIPRASRLRMLAPGTCSIALTAKGRTRVVVIAVAPSP